MPPNEPYQPPETNSENSPNDNNLGAPGSPVQPPVAGLPPLQNTQPPLAPLPPQLPPKKSSKALVVAVIIVIVVAIILVVIFLLLPKDDPGDSRGSESSPSSTHQPSPQPSGTSPGQGQASSSKIPTKNDMFSLVAGIEDYTSNNNGMLPRDQSELDSALKGELGSLSGSYTINFKASNDLGSPTKAGEIDYLPGYTCNAETGPLSRSSSRSFALFMALPNGGVTCESN